MVTAGDSDTPFDDKEKAWMIQETISATQAWVFCEGFGDGQWQQLFGSGQSAPSEEITTRFTLRFKLRIV